MSRDIQQQQPCALMRTQVRRLGYDPGVLYAVKQAGCVYAGADAVLGGGTADDMAADANASQILSDVAATG